MVIIMIKQNLIIKTKKIQADILSNFGNSAYQRISKDIYFDYIPNDLYTLWYLQDKFSFRQLIDLNNIQYLSDTELLEYYTQLVSLNTKLEVIFNNIEKQRLNRILKNTNNKKINLLKKLIKLLYGG